MNAMGERHRGVRARSLAVSVLSIVGALAPMMWSSATGASPVITSPAQGGLSPAMSGVVVKGTAPAGTNVQVFEGLTSLGSAATAANGKWQVVSSMADGSHTIFAVAHDSSGIDSPPSDTVTFTADIVRPTIAITSPDDQHVFQPGETLSVGGTATDARGIFAIRIEYWLYGKKQKVELTSCDACGGAQATTAWHDNPTGLLPGYYVAHVVSIDMAGNVSLPQERTFVNGLDVLPGVILPTPPTVTPPDPPVITQPQPGDVLPGAGQPIHFDGSADPGSTITIHDNKHDLGPIGTVTSGDDGRWTYATSLPTGNYDVWVQANQPDGQTSVSNIISFGVDADPPVVSLLTANDTVFLPTQPVVIEGRILDNQHVGAVQVEYWMLDKMMLREWANCAGCSQQEALWRDLPNLPQPGTYVVRATGFDRAGNRTYSAQVTFVKTA